MTLLPPPPLIVSISGSPPRVEFVIRGLNRGNSDFITLVREVKHIHCLV